MGPRLDSRGDGAVSARPRAGVAALEWGHDWIVVETQWIVHDPAVGVSATLEWGHDWIVVETELVAQLPDLAEEA